LISSNTLCITLFNKNSGLNAVTILGTVVLGFIMVLLLSSLSFVKVNQAQGSLGTCPVGYQRSASGICVPISSQVCPVGYERNALGICEPVSSLQSCPVGYQRSASGFCVPVTSLQSCPVGYQTYPPGICVPVADSLSNLYPYGYPTTAVNPYGPQTTLSQPQTTFTQPSSTSTASLVSPTLTSPSTAQMSPWFPSLPAIACGGTSTMTTIGSIEGDSDSDDNNDNIYDNDEDDSDKKDYAFLIESDGGPSADPESVDGKVFAGEKNIERNNGRDFDIKDVFNDCQVSMFND
jgi:hypothetical protein